MGVHGSLALFAETINNFNLCCIWPFEDSDNEEEPQWWPKKRDCSRLTIARSLLGLKALKVIPLNPDCTALH